MQGVVGAFHEIDTTVAAIEDLKKKKLGEVTVYSPTIRHELEHAIDAPQSVVRRFTLIGGLLGVIVGDAIGVPWEFQPANTAPRWRPWSC